MEAASETNGLASIASQVRCPPNALQEAVATYVMSLLTRSPRQMWQLRGGIGKSRGIAYRGLIGLLSLGLPRVHFVLPNKMLMQRELQEFGDYWRLSQSEDRVAYHCAFDFQHEPGELIIIDEADFLVLKNPGSVAEFLGETNVIGFSSSLNETKHRDMEATVLRDL